jgi:hypothetical protein
LKVCSNSVREFGLQIIETLGPNAFESLVQIYRGLGPILFANSLYSPSAAWHKL